MAEVQTPRVARPTGALFDPHDHRDKPLYSAEQVAVIRSSSKGPKGPKPDQVDKIVLKKLPPVYNQGRLGSCVANACCAALRYAYVKHTGKEYEDYDPSRLFAYYFGRTTGRIISNKYVNLFNPDAIDKNVGTWNRAVLQTFYERGVCKEYLWPYENSTVDEELGVFNTATVPNPTRPQDWDLVQIQADRAVHSTAGGPAVIGVGAMIPRAISYFRIYEPQDTDAESKQLDFAWEQETPPSIALLEQTLRDGFPFIFACRTYPDFCFYEENMEDGVYVNPSDVDLGDSDDVHTLLAIGFDSSKRLFLIQNSWGEYYTKPEEGSKGRFWMPYEWFEVVVNNEDDGEDVFVSDYWVIKPAPPQSKPAPPMSSSARPKSKLATPKSKPAQILSATL